MNLVHTTVQESPTLQAGADYGIVLIPEEGYVLPEIIRVEIDDILYEVYTDGLEHRVLAEGESELPPMPTFYPVTGTLMIPAVLLGEDTQSVTITASSMAVIALCDDTEGSAEASSEDLETIPDDAKDTAVLLPENKEEEQGNEPEGDDDTEVSSDRNDQSGDAATDETNTDSNEEAAE